MKKNKKKEQQITRTQFCSNTDVYTIITFEEMKMNKQNDKEKKRISIEKFMSRYM